MNFDTLPVRLKDYPQWVLWRLEPKPNEPKPSKIPYNPHSPSQRASSTDRKTWGTFAEAKSVYESGGFSGVGFVFNNDDPFIAIDFDHCIENGKLTNCAFVNTSLFDSYTEISQSGTGLHVIGIGLNPSEDGKGHKRGDIEFYTHGRFFALTGEVWENHTEIKQLSGVQLSLFYEKYFPVETKPQKKDMYIQKPKRAKELSDDRIIELCSNAKNSSKFTSLWRGNTSGYNSHSEADLALISILSFYTQDPLQLQRMMSASGLAREKTGREDYTGRTINKALSGVHETFGQETGICYFCKKPIGKTQVGEIHPRCGKMRLYP